MKNKKLLVFAFFSILVLTLGTIFAFGVAGSNGPFSISPGETRTTSFRLQNMAGDGDINVQVDLTAGSEIASIVGSNQYLVKSGTKDTEVFVKITVPADAQIGDTYKITLSIRTITPGNEQGVSLGSAIGQDIEVIVVSEATNTTFGVLPFLIGAGILILGAIIFFYMRKVRSKRK